MAAKGHRLFSAPFFRRVRGRWANENPAGIRAASELPQERKADQTSIANSSGSPGNASE
jgi:hypothetical protein